MDKEEELKKNTDLQLLQQAQQQLQTALQNPIWQHQPEGGFTF